MNAVRRWMVQTAGPEVSSDHSPPVRMARQLGGGGVMFWAAIIGDTLTGPFRVENGGKINATTYSAILDK